MITWLTTIARNTALNRTRTSSHFYSADEIPENTPSSDPTPEEVIMQQERQAAFHLALQQLYQRKVVSPEKAASQNIRR